MGDSLSLENFGLRIPSAPMVCWGIFIAALAYSFTGCLGSAPPTTPPMAPRDADKVLEGMGDSNDNFFVPYPLNTGRGFGNNEDKHDRTVDGIPEHRKEISSNGDLTLENLIMQNYAKSMKFDGQNSAIPKRSYDAYWKGEEEKNSIQKFNETKTSEVTDNTSSDIISSPSSYNSTGQETVNLFERDSNSSQIDSIYNIIVNNNPKLDTKVPYQELLNLSNETKIKTNRSFQDSETELSQKNDFSAFNPEAGQMDHGSEVDSLKHLIQNTVMRLETSLDDLYHRELKSEILDFLEFGDEENDNIENNDTSIEMLSQNDLTNYDNDNRYDNIDKSDNAASSSENSDDDDEDYYNLFMDHLREEYNDHATYAILHAVETRTIPQDLEFWKMVSRFLDTPTYLRRSKRSARSSRWRSPSYQEWQRRRRQHFGQRMSITYSHVVPCAFRDRFYCINGGTCVFVQALDIKTCRCPIGYTGVRCELIDKEYILTLLSNQLIFR